MSVTAPATNAVASAKSLRKSLEREARSELQDASVAITAGGAGDGAGCCVRQYAGARVANVRIRVGEVNMIERIVGIRSDIEFDSFPVKQECLGQAEVHIGEARANQDVASGIAEGAVGGVCKCGGVEPVSERRIRNVRIADDLGIERGTAGERGRETGINRIRNGTLNDGSERQA